MSLFVIRPLNAAGQVTAHPMHSIARDDWSYVYLLSGEVLIDIDRRPYLLKASDFALIPPSIHYSVKYFKDTIGYMGAFSTGLLRNAGPFRASREGTVGSFNPRGRQAFLR